MPDPTLNVMDKRKNACGSADLKIGGKNGDLTAEIICRNNHVSSWNLYRFDEIFTDFMNRIQTFWMIKGTLFCSCHILGEVEKLLGLFISIMKDSQFL